MSISDFISIDTLLFDYATGNLNEAEAIMIATHLVLKPAAQIKIKEYENMGGELIKAVDPMNVPDRMFDDIMNIIDENHLSKNQNCQESNLENPYRIPEPIYKYLQETVTCDEVTWKKTFRGLHVCDLSRVIDDCENLNLMKLKPKCNTPKHHHDSPEITLVIEGAYKDEFGKFDKGDIEIINDTAKSHKPMSCPEHGCVTLVLSPSGMKFDKNWHKLRNIFLKL